MNAGFVGTAGFSAIGGFGRLDAAAAAVVVVVDGGGRCVWLVLAVFVRATSATVAAVLTFVLVFTDMLCSLRSVASRSHPNEQVYH